MAELSLEARYPDGPIRTYKLGYPKADLSWTVLKFWRRLLVEDLLAMEDKGVTGKRYLVDALRRLCLVPSSDLHKMDAYDFGQLDKVLESFLEDGPPKSKESTS